MAASILRKHGFRFFPVSTGCRYLRSVGSQIVTSAPEALTSERSSSMVDNFDIRVHNSADDMPIADLENPYEKERRVCLLCKHNVKLDYKNPKLLSQFVSQFTGQIYGKHITGLCSEQQKKLELVVAQSRGAGYMPYEYKDIKYFKDPKLFDPSNQPARKHY